MLEGFSSYDGDDNGFKGVRMSILSIIKALRLIANIKSSNEEYKSANVKGKN